MSVKISRILHAGYIVECGKTQIAFDPIFENPFSRNCHAFPNVRFDTEQIRKLKFSAVFISHFHDDHCSFESLNYLDRSIPIYAYCVFEELFSLIKELGFHHVYPLAIDVPVFIGVNGGPGMIEIIPRRALDFEVDSIFHIKANGLNILNVVDSWIDTPTLNELVQSAPWDIVLWPFQTMREIEVIAPSRAEPAPSQLPNEWIEQLKVLKPRFVVPSSCQFIHEDWSWYNRALFPISYRQFKKEVESVLPGSLVMRIDPSIGFLVDQNSIRKAAPLSWIEPIGNQDVDYEYDAKLNPPHTSEVSRRFLPRSPEQAAEQAARVYEFCQIGIIGRYKSIAPSEEPYFKIAKKKGKEETKEMARIWRLSVYNHAGNCRAFHYILNENGLEICSENAGVLVWVTDVPEAKLFAALELGESLTSMYLRINDVEFAPEIEHEIKVNDVDIAGDPLIRCLFNGVFGSYQIAQLKKLGLRS